MSHAQIDAPERVTMARMIGSDKWEPMPMGHTMSMGYAECIEYYRKPTLAQAMMVPEVRELVEALTLAANRLHRLSVEFTPGSRNFIEAGEWAAEAHAALHRIGETK